MCLVADLKLNNPEFRQMLADIKFWQQKVDEMRRPLNGPGMFAVDAMIAQIEREENGGVECMLFGATDSVTDTAST